MMKRFLIFLALFFGAASVFAEIQIVTPRDKLIIFDELVMLQGRTDSRDLKINDVSFTPAEDGRFACGLALHRGKNLASVAAGGKEINLRVLRLITYPDIEEEYEGKKHWARAQIVYLSALGMIEGYPDGNFFPGNPITRGEFATWLAKAKKLPVEAHLAADPFFDVPKEHWRASYVKAVVEAGYLTPYSKETFGIDDPIARREAADIVVHAEGLGIISKVTPIFRDVPKEEKDAIPIYTAHESGLIIGTSSDIPVYDPERALTRAEAAVLISRFAVAQNGIRYLYSFESGYIPENYCQLEVSPEVAALTVEPGRVKLDQATTIKLRARLAPRGAFPPISKVKADLTDIGGMPDAEMFDDGTHGDETAGDGVYSLNFSFNPKESGENTLRVIATDRFGWEGKKEATLQVVE